MPGTTSASRPASELRSLYVLAGELDGRVGARDVPCPPGPDPDPGGRDARVGGARDEPARFLDVRPGARGATIGVAGRAPARAACARITSNAISSRFAPTVAPTIAVSTAKRPASGVEARARRRQRAGERRREAGRLRPASTSRGAPRPGRSRGRPAGRPRGRPARSLSSGTVGSAVSTSSAPSEPAAEPEHEHVAASGSRRSPAAQPPRCAPAAPARGARRTASAAKPSIDGEHDLGERRLREAGREVDRAVRVERGVDRAAVEEGVDEVRARRRAGSSRSRPCGRGRAGRPGGRSAGAAAARGSRSAAASRSRGRRRSGASAPASPHAAVGVVVGAGRPGVAQRPPAQRKSVPGLPRIEPPPAGRGEVALRGGGVAAGDRCDVALDLDRRGSTSWASTDRSQSPLASPSAAESQRVDGHRRGDRRGAAASRSSGRRTTAEADVARLDRQEPPAVGHVRRRRVERRGQVVASAGCTTASSAQRAAYLWICSSVGSGYQRKLPGGFTPIITERWMLLRVAPGVDHRRARAGALAEQVERP